MKVITRMIDCLLAITCLFVAAVAAPQLFGLEVYTVLSAVSYTHLTLPTKRIV